MGKKVDSFTRHIEPHEVYMLFSAEAGELLYVGCGMIGRAQNWTSPARRQRILGIDKTIAVEIRYARFVTSMDNAYRVERELIEELKPPYNKSLGKSRKGTKSGRPKGTPMPKEHRDRLSAILQGRSNHWLIGKEPWNKGKPQTEETKRKISESLKARNRSNRGE